MTSRPAPAPARAGWRAPLLIAGVALALHAPAVLGGRFVDFDDWFTMHVGQAFLDGTAIAADMIAAAVDDPFEFRSVTQAPLCAVLYQVCGDVAPLYLLFHLVLHVLLALVVWQLALRLFRRGDLALFAGLLLAVLPQGWEALVLPSRTFWLLSTLLAFRSLELFYEYREHRRLGAYLTSFLWFVLAVCARDAAVVLPLVLAWDLLVVRDAARPPVRRDWWLLLPYLLSVALLGAVVLLGSPGLAEGAAATSPEQGELSALAAIASQPAEILRRLLLVYPVALLSFVNPGHLPSCISISVLWLLGAVGLCVAALVRRRLAGRPALFAIGLVVLGALPLLPGLRTVAEVEARYLLLPVAALALIVADALAVLDPRPRLQRVVALALLLPMAIVTAGTQHDFRRRTAPQAELNYQVVTLAKSRPVRSHLLLLDTGGPVSAEALAAPLMAARFARPDLRVGVLQEPRVCPAGRPAAPGWAEAVAVYWWRGRYVQSDLDRAARLLAAAGCPALPGVAQTPVWLLAQDGDRALVGRLQPFGRLVEIWRSH